MKTQLNNVFMPQSLRKMFKRSFRLRLDQALDGLAKAFKADPYSLGLAYFASGHRWFPYDFELVTVIT